MRSTTPLWPPLANALSLRIFFEGTINIEILPAGDAWARTQPLVESVWAPQKMAASSWRDICTADAWQRALVRDDDGQLVSHVGIFQREAKWGDRGVRVGGVFTKDGCRRRGLARAGTAHAANDMKTEMAADFGLLFCNKPNYRFHENCSGMRFCGDVFVEQPSGRMHLNISAPYILPLVSHAVNGLVELKKLPS